MTALKLTQFLALVLTALALVPGGAHLFAMPNKIDLAQTDYFIAQSVYRGWAWLGTVLIGAIVINFILTIMVRRRPLGFVLTAFNLLCLVANLAIFFAWTFPANQATNNWTVVPANWEMLRTQWEYSHAINAAITFVGFCSLAISVLVTPGKPSGAG
jgi:hypothetical protein